VGTFDAEEHPARHVAWHDESSPWGKVAAALGLVVLASGGLAAWSYGGTGSDSPAAVAGHTCGQEPVVLAASRDLARPLGQALAAAGCDNVSMLALDADEVRTNLISGTDVPDFWIPDSSLWIVTSTARTVPTVLVASIASTPVVLAGHGDDVPSTWAEALTDPSLVMGDPLTSTTAAVPLLLGTASQASADAALTIAPVAQRQADNPAAGFDDLHRIQQAAQTPAGVTATTEQALISSGSALEASVPSPGTWLLDYPLVLTAAPERAAEIKDVGTALAAFSSGDELASALDEASFRPAGGAAIQGGVGSVPTAPTPTEDAVLQPLAVWSTLAVPIRALAVVDVSASMDFPAEHGTRMDVTVAALRAGLSLFPDSAAAGLWAFSEKLDGPRDYRELVPLRPLGTSVGSATQREAIDAKVSTLTGLTTQGTGLYDTTLAAYRALQREYDPNAVNSILLFSDGANDDPESISEDELVAQLTALQDPERPIQIIAIGITHDADEAALSRIATATGGFSMIAERPEDMAAIFQKAMEARF
jgi:hypothetical protein